VKPGLWRSMRKACLRSAARVSMGKSVGRLDEEAERKFLD
jgi:hypothetical protein